MLPVIMANDAELSLHEALLDKMQKKGKCVWRDS